MKRPARRAGRPTTAARARAPLALAALALLGACSDFKDELLEPQQPGIISPVDVSSSGATGADALRIGALGWLQNWTGGGGNVNQENIWMMADLLTDVWKSSDTFVQRNDTDRRNVTTNNGTVSSAYQTATRSRGFYRAAINALKGVTTTDRDAKIAEMYFALGYTETNLAEIFCNGIPLSETVDGQVKYAEPLSNQQVYAAALVHLDSAIALASGSSALATSVRNAAAVAKGRTLVDMGRFADAATAVAGVPVAYQYTLTYSQPTQSNEIWNLNFSRSSARYTVGDSVDHVTTLIRNAIPFASAKDPRVPTTGSSTNTGAKGIDNATPWVGQLIWQTREAPVVLASGIDAQLIAAEARLQANDIGGMTTILNTLRGSARTLGAFAVPAMAALPTPATKDAAVNLLFREKAFWQFARGTRLGDLRRLIRQYGRTQDNVFPAGTFHKENLPYGSDVNLPVTDNETTNPNFKGCTDRNA
jgi:starch-binding outer membrane protein, SusD/RagB family